MRKFTTYYLLMACLVMAVSVWSTLVNGGVVMLVTIGLLLFVGYYQLSGIVAEATRASPDRVHGSYVILDDETGPVLSIAMDIPETEAMAESAITLVNSRPTGRPLKAEQR